MEPETQNDLTLPQTNFDWNNLDIKKKNDSYAGENHKY